MCQPDKHDREYPHDYCLMWPFGKNSTGYGMIGRAGKMMYAHRYICELVHGAPPSPMHQAAHSCGRGDKGCVNPRHLSWKTPSENQMDRHSYGSKFFGRRGKLTAEQVAEICRSPESSRILAERFGVTEAAIRQRRA